MSTPHQRGDFARAAALSAAKAQIPDPPKSIRRPGRRKPTYGLLHGLVHVEGAVDQSRSRTVPDRFLSPVFVFNNQNKEVLRLVGAGLTNRPNLLLTALARQETPSMDDNLKAQLKEILGLPGTASDDDIISLCKVSTAPDPSRYVPVDQVAVMVEELASLKSQHDRGKGGQYR